MPRVILHWLALVEFLGLTAEEYDKHNNIKATVLMMLAMPVTATTATPTTRMAATMATTTKVTWTAMAAATMTTTTMMSTMTATTMGRQQCDGNNDNGTTTI